MKQIFIIILLSFSLTQDCDEGYTYIPASEIPFSATSLPFNPETGEFNTCFNDFICYFILHTRVYSNLLCTVGLNQHQLSKKSSRLSYKLQHWLW